MIFIEKYLLALRIGVCDQGPSKWFIRKLVGFENKQKRFSQYLCQCVMLFLRFLKILWELSVECYLSHTKADMKKILWTLAQTLCIAYINNEYQP